MMRDDRGAVRCGLWAGLAAVIAAAPAAAGPMDYAYRTRGELDAPSIRFRGLNDGRYTGPGAVPLGSLVITPPGRDMTYGDVDFGIGFEIPDLGRILGAEAEGGFHQLLASFGLYGTLSGTVLADGRADLTLVLDPGRTSLYQPGMGYPAWLTGSALPFELKDIRVGPTLHIATPAGGGSVAVTAQVVPEPTALAAFAATFAGLTLRRRLRGRGA